MLKKLNWTSLALLAIIVLSIVLINSDTGDAKAFKKLSKALKMKKLKKYLPFMMMGPRVIIIQTNSDPGYGSNIKVSTSRKSKSVPEVEVLPVSHIIRQLDSLRLPPYWYGGKYQYFYKK